MGALHSFVVHCLILVSLWTCFPHKLDLSVGLPALNLTLFEKSFFTSWRVFFDWICVAGKLLLELPCVSVYVLIFSLWNLSVFIFSMLLNLSEPARIVTSKSHASTPRLPWFSLGTAALPHPPFEHLSLLVSALSSSEGLVDAGSSRKIISAALAALPDSARNWLLGVVTTDSALYDDVGKILSFLKALTPKKINFASYLELFSLKQNLSPLRKFLALFSRLASAVDLPEEGKMAALYLAVDPAVKALAPWSSHHDSLDELVRNLLDLTIPVGASLIPPRAAPNLAAMLAGALKIRSGGDSVKMSPDDDLPDSAPASTTFLPPVLVPSALIAPSGLSSAQLLPGVDVVASSRQIRSLAILDRPNFDKPILTSTLR